MGREASCTFRVRAVPNARRTACEGLREDGSYRIRVQAPPDRGRANRALIDFLARALGVRRSQVTLLRGDASREKVFQVQGRTEPEVAVALASPPRED